jgi:assimilatory nitrate reductase catalytic subunit
LCHAADSTYSGIPAHLPAGRFASRAAVGAVANPAVDPESGEPEYKHAPVRIAPFAPRWHGFVLASRELVAPPAEVWTMTRGEGHFRYELAGSSVPGDWGAAARRKLGESGEWVEMIDPGAGRYRGARLVRGRLEGCLFVAPGPRLPPRDWLASLFGDDALDDTARAWLLSARPADVPAGTGPVVCSCFGIGRDTLLRAVREQGAADTGAIGRLLQAGTSCGSCLPEIEQIISDHRVGNGEGEVLRIEREALGAKC